MILIDFQLFSWIFNKSTCKRFFNNFKTVDINIKKIISLFDLRKILYKLYLLMYKKLFYIILLLCFFKLFHVAYKSVQFSPNILFNSFKRNVAEKSSLGFASNDVIPLRDFFLDRNISEFSLSKKLLKKKTIIFYT